MKKYLFAVLTMFSLQLQAHGYIITTSTSRLPNYVCFGGRMLTASSVGLAWEAKRSCFISRQPCASLQADTYGAYFNSRQLRHAYANCRFANPFRWGAQ